MKGEGRGVGGVGGASPLGGQEVFYTIGSSVHLQLLASGTSSYDQQQKTRKKKKNHFLVFVLSSSAFSFLGRKRTKSVILRFFFFEKPIRIHPVHTELQLQVQVHFKSGSSCKSQSNQSVNRSHRINAKNDSEIS